MRHDGAAGLHTEINVAPLVDVCLVLLIIFMVVSPLIIKGPSIELPRTTHPEKRPQTEAQLPITLLFDAPPQILFGKSFRRLKPGELRAATEELYQKSPNAELVIRADKRLSYADVRAVLSVLRDVGFHSVNLIAEPGGVSSDLR